MERRRKSRYLIWLFPLVVMIMIFSFSGQQGEESSSMSNMFVNLFLQIRGTLGLFPKFADAELVNLISLVVRKGAHVTEYVLLCTSFLTAFWISGVHGIFVLLYSSLDMHARMSFISYLYLGEQDSFEMF